MAEDTRELTKAELAAYLDELRIAVITTNGGDATPQSTPVWYMPDGDSVGIIADADSVKARNLRRDPRASVLIASESPPYWYVSYQGEVELAEGVPDDYRWRMATRYLGAERARRYLDRTAPYPPGVVIRIRPRKTTTWLYTAED